jgi:hypothetical protein
MEPVFRKVRGISSLAQRLLYFSRMCYMNTEPPEYSGKRYHCVRFQVLTAASMMFRAVFWDILPCKMSSSLIMEAVRTSETSVDNHFTRQYNPEDSSEALPLLAGKEECLYEMRLVAVERRRK